MKFDDEIRAAAERAADKQISMPSLSDTGLVQLNGLAWKARQRACYLAGALDFGAKREAWARADERAKHGAHYGSYDSIEQGEEADRLYAELVKP